VLPSFACNAVADEIGKKKKKKGKKNIGGRNWSEWVDSVLGLSIPPERAARRRYM
jgi:hypothetical protein